MNKDVLNTNPNGTKNHLPFTIEIEGREYQWPNQFITGLELRNLAKLKDHVDLYLAISEPWDDEQISSESKVDLAREGIESFYVRGDLDFVVNDKLYKSKKQFITGAEIRKVAKLEMHEEIYLLIQRPFEDELIEDSTLIDLARPGIEQFHAKKKHEELLVEIKINDKPYKLKRGFHTVAELKKRASIPAIDELFELIAGKLEPLDDDSTVLIKGCEQFFSCKREGTSS